MARDRGTSAGMTEPNATTDPIAIATMVAKRFDEIAAEQGDYDRRGSYDDFARGARAVVAALASGGIFDVSFLLQPEDDPDYEEPAPTAAPTPPPEVVAEEARVQAEVDAVRAQALARAQRRIFGA